MRLLILALALCIVVVLIAFSLPSVIGSSECNPPVRHFLT